MAGSEEQSIDDTESLRERNDLYAKIAEKFRAIDELIRTHWRKITGFSTIAAFVVAVLDAFFQTEMNQFVPAIGSAFSQATTSNATIVALLLILIFSHIYYLRGLRSTVVELRRMIEESENGEDSEDDLRTDGGSSSLPPRDRKGRFVSRSKSGGSGVLLFILAALAGYIYGQQFGSTEALVGALIGIAVAGFLAGRN